MVPLRAGGFASKDLLDSFLCRDVDFLDSVYGHQVGRRSSSHLHTSDLACCKVQLLLTVACGKQNVASTIVIQTKLLWTTNTVELFNLIQIHIVRIIFCILPSQLYGWSISACRMISQTHVVVTNVDCTESYVAWSALSKAPC